MDFLHSVSEFKNEHRYHYWIRILAFSFSMVFLGLWLSGNGAGDTEILDIDSDTTGLTYGTADPMVGVCPSNRWYVPYIGQGDINISWTDDNGTTWNHSTIISDGWDGETHMSVVSIQTWSNNTTCFAVRTEDVDYPYQLWLFYLWGDNDPSEPTHWNRTELRQSNTAIGRHISMTFNRTGILHIVWYENNAIYERTWDVSDASMTSTNLWLSIQGYPWVQCDHNNNVWVSYQNGANLWCKSWDKVVSIQKSGMTYFDLGSFFITGDNTKVWTGHYQYLSNHAKAVVYESVTNTTLTSNTFASNTDSWEISYWNGGNCHGQKTVSVVLLRKETGSEEYIEYKAAYDALDSTWEASETVLWTVPTDDDLAYHTGNSPCSVWPKIENVSVNHLTSGRIHVWQYKDEQGSPDDWYDMVYFDEPTFPYWDWSPPSEPGPGDDTETEDDFSYGFEWCHAGHLVFVFVFLILFTLLGVFMRTAL